MGGEIALADFFEVCMTSFIIYRCIWEKRLASFVFIRCRLTLFILLKVY